MIARLVAQRDDALHRADALAEAVGGLMHDEDCDNTPCTCGLDDIFAKLAAYEGGGR